MFLFAAFIYSLSTIYALPQWSVSSGLIHKDGQRFKLHAASMFGMETRDKLIQGTWVCPSNLTEEIIKVQSWGFNAIRLPIAADYVTDNVQVRAKWCGIEATGYTKRPYLEALDFFIDIIGQSGMYVMLDMHHIFGGSSGMDVYYDETIQNNDPTTGKLYQAWDILSARYALNSYVMGADVKNEAHADPGNKPQPITMVFSDILPIFESIGTRILTNAPHWLVCLQGLNNQPGANWGGSFADLTLQQLSNIPFQSQLVLTPHIYGPSVYWQSHFQSNDEATFKQALRDKMDLFFGDKKDLGYAVAIGEWGGRFVEPNINQSPGSNEIIGSKDVWYMEELRAYMQLKDIDHMFWNWAFHGADTDGLVLNTGSALAPHYDAINFNRAIIGLPALP